ncbi:MAG: AI-2E family transporter [Bacteroidales bacterium]|nr:AI-2E family transporter [Bacteroidales bacterium]
MNNSTLFYKRWYIFVPLLIIAGFLIWEFSAIIVYIIIAAILSLIGHPLVKLLDRIKIKKFKFPHVLSSLITLLVIIVVSISLFSFIVPLIMSQTSSLANIDIQSIVNSLNEPINKLELFLKDYGLLNNDKNIETIVKNEISVILNRISFSNIINSIVSYIGNAFVAFFAISFFTFFFLKDDHLFINGIMLITPEKYQDNIANILRSCKKLLTRYFIGICIDLTLVISLITLGVNIIGIKNAFIIGFCAGMFNFIPYVGPIIGGALAILVAITGNLDMDFYTQMLPMALKLIGIFVTVNILDGVFFQPTIYANSVKAHPLEIFTVILMSSTLFGIVGMIIAIPSYTVIRIIAKEFLNKLRIVQKLTRNI